MAIYILNQTHEIATPEELENYDGIIFGSPTHLGNMSGQMRTFLDQTGGLWAEVKLIGKAGSVFNSTASQFNSTASQHGGQESMILSFHITLLHQGMIVVGLPYSCKEQLTLDEIAGGTPYGATTIAGSDGSRKVSEIELKMAHFQGHHVAMVSAKLANKELQPL